MPGLSAVTGDSGLSGIMGGVYSSKVLSYSPIAYWILDETAGGTAVDQINSPAQDGAYTGVTLGQTVTDTNGVSFVCPFFDGANDFVDVNSAALEAAIGLAEGSLMCWGRVFNAAVWADGLDRYLAQTPYFGGQDYVRIFKNANTVRWTYESGNVNENYAQVSADTDWFHMMMTWSVAADLVTYYLGGASVATDNTLGVQGDFIFSVTRNCIGAFDTGATLPWHGWLAHCALFGSALDAPSVADLAVV